MHHELCEEGMREVRGTLSPDEGNPRYILDSSGVSGFGMVGGENFWGYLESMVAIPGREASNIGL